MKHLKLYENIESLSFIKKTAKDIKKILKYYHPIVFKRSNEIANDEFFNYGQDLTDVYGGSSFITIHNISDTELTMVKLHNDKIFFTLEFIDTFDDSDYTFFVPFTDEELKQAIMEQETDKYNI